MNLNSLDEFYDFLEKDTNLSHLNLDSYKPLRTLRDNSDDENTKRLCSYELIFADFSIEEGKHIPLFQIGETAYPTLDLFDDNFQYIKERANKVQNPKYKAKYNHLLCLSPIKHIDFAKNAIDSYLLLLESSSFSVDDKSQCYSFGNYFKNLLVLSLQFSYKKDAIIRYFVSLLESEKLNNFTNYSLMFFIVEKLKNIDDSTKQLFFDYSKNKIYYLNDQDLEDYLKLLILLSQKIKISPSEYYQKLGDYYISKTEDEQNKGLINDYYYTKALEEYRKANKKEKIELTAVLFEQSKKTIDLKKVSLEIEDKYLMDILNHCRNKTRARVDEIVGKCESKAIYEYLIFENIFPKANKLTEEIGNPFFDSVTTMAFDINYNVSPEKTSGISTYHLQINIFSVPHIELVFSRGLKNGKISFDSLIEYLKSNSWYGRNFTYLDGNNETQGFDWIELLSPALKSFFTQIEIDQESIKPDSQGFILAIDSIVLKFEGLLREFSRMVGAQTIEIRRNSTEERINFEKLLDNEKIKALVPEDDIAYFKFLFTSKGVDLRNNIAHSFFRVNNYTSNYMLLLVVALLRLGNCKSEE